MGSQDSSTSVSQTPQGLHLLSKDSHRSRVGPSRQAWRVISAITSFGSPLPWELLETGQEGGLLPLRASTPSVDCQAMLLPRPATSVTIPVASLLLLWKLSVSSVWAVSGASPQLPMSRLCITQHRSMLRVLRDRVQGCSVAQLEEGLDAAPRDGAHSPGRGRLLLECSLCRARPPCPSACVSLCHANATHVQSVERSLLCLEEGQCLVSRRLGTALWSAS
ncbi:Hypothetical protein DHA2_151561 [Giardia duodenalis]|uniref:Uncharacterized protein n=1 Tax=Giardia intestinalis TaxID=5741 RepID=V6TLY9_GIAIN|nr:Hypothetical protein DHA2_151561 [Giardia intestinalis]